MINEEKEELHCPDDVTEMDTISSENRPDISPSPSALYEKTPDIFPPPSDSLHLRSLFDETSPFPCDMLHFRSLYEETQEIPPSLSDRHHLRFLSQKTPNISPSPGDQLPLHSLSASLKRKISESSDEYFTPPTSPSQLIARTIPLKTLTSTPKELKIGLSINLHDLHQACNEHPCEAISLERHLQVSLSIHPATDTIQRKRSSSTPTTPKFSIKPFSRSLDEASNQESPDSSPELPHRNTDKLIKEILYKNIDEFVKCTDLKSLYTHLISAELISGPDLEELDAKKATSRGKNIYFYTGLLETKGPDAYRRLFECLKKEREHLGHKNLVRIVDKKLKYHMFRNDFP